MAEVSRRAVRNQPTAITGTRTSGLPRTTPRALPLQRLTRTVGNAGMYRLLRSPIQRQLTVGPADDDYEGEAPRLRTAGVQARLLVNQTEDMFHRDDQADALARATRARAVTIGSKIYFRRGEYAPDTSRGRELIAHELVHVAQGARHGVTSGANEGAEQEARDLASAMVANAAIPAVRHAASPIMFDPLPDPDLGQDKETIKGELLLKYPYIARLSNKREVLETFADFIRFKRRAMELKQQLEKIPAITQGATRAIEKRERERAPFERAQAKNISKLAAVATTVLINPLEVLAPDFYSGGTAALTAGANALAKELSKNQAWLTVERGGFDAFGFGLTPYISGVWLPIDEDGIHLNFFKRQSYVTTVMLEMESVWLNAVIEVTDEQHAAFVDQAPYIAEYALETMLEEMREARRAREEPTEDERLVLEMQSQRKAYAANVQEAAAAAVAPLILLASFFAFEGPLDLLLTIAPVHKLGKAFKIGKAAIGKKGSKALAKIGKELLEHLDDESKFFLKLAAKLSKAEVRALKTIYKHTQSPAVIKTLMQRHLTGTANVKWIAKKLEQKKFDGKFVDEVTRFPANPSWKTFEDIVEKRGVSGDVRDALAAQMKGFLGEEAASVFVRAQSMAGKVFRGRKGAKLTKVERSIEYGTSESLDLMAMSDKAELLFGEVKHWSASTWASASNRAETLAQLERHNAGIDAIRKQMSRRATDVTDRVLYVSQDGFSALSREVRDEFVKEVKKRDWTIAEIPDSSISDFKGLIDRVR